MNVHDHNKIKFKMQKANNPQQTLKVLNIYKEATRLVQLINKKIQKTDLAFIVLAQRHTFTKVVLPKTNHNVSAILRRICVVLLMLFDDIDIARFALYDAYSDNATGAALTSPS